MGIFDTEPVSDETQTRTRELFFRKKEDKDNRDIWLNQRGAIDLGHWNDIKDAVKRDS